MRSSGIWSTVLCVVLATTARAETRGLVVTFHPQATDAAVTILKSGGNAFDAFVAATFAEYVVNEGGTSAAGSLGGLIYEAKSRTIKYLDAEFNSVRDPTGTWSPSRAWRSDAADSGKAVLVPGAVAGLEALSQRYGRKTFSEVLQPAIKLAQDGFKIQGFYRAALIASVDILKNDSYTSRTFLRHGSPLSSGDVLRQPELASFLKALAAQGGSYMYRGKWATDCVQAVKSRGGRMTLDDLAAYRPVWRDPLKINYRGFQVYSPSGRTFGGLWAMLALKTLEHTEIAPLGHFSRSADALEIMVRTAREALAEPWIYDYRQLDRPEELRSKLNAEYTSRIWQRVLAKRAGAAKRRTGSHSYHIIVIDSEGNIASGTNTHESLAWGNGVFVQGVPLNTAGRIPWLTRPGERQLSPFSMHLVMRDGKFFAATGAFSSSLLEAAFQFLVNVIDYHLSASEAVTLPRFGTFPYDPAAAMSISVTARLAENAPNWLDSRVSSTIVDTLAPRGLQFVQGAWVDTGLGAVVTRGPEGAITPWVQIGAPPGTVQVIAGGSR